jgi:hypothetical protein
MDSMRSHNHGRRNFDTAVEKVLSLVHLRKDDNGIKPQRRMQEADMVSSGAEIPGPRRYSNGNRFRAVSRGSEVGT